MKTRFGAARESSGRRRPGHDTHNRSRRRRAAPLIAAASALLVLVAGCGGSGQKTAGPAAAAPLQLPDVGGPVVVAVGDMVCGTGDDASPDQCQDAETAKLAKRYDPAYVLALGDEQYGDGGLSDFHKYYDKTWGAFYKITKPVPGNHEYDVSRAAPYFAYFKDKTTRPGYYAFDIARWRVYALNSNCAFVDCGKEAAWLDRDMTRNPRRCSLMFMHHPRYSSGSEHGSSPEVRPFWAVADKHHLDLALAGHDHDFERFRPMNADDQVTDKGIASFVVGTGGRSLQPMRKTRHKGSVGFDNITYGVLALELGKSRFSWRYRTIDGVNIGSGTHACH